jgi:choline dehydrogenase-like flavoprotein
VVSITAIDSSGEERNILVGNAAVVLSAGTLGSAAIALRSGLGERRPHGNDIGSDLVGKGLMDHDIWGTRFEILQGQNLAVLNKQPLKLNTWVKFGNDPVLVNVAVNADTFLGRTQVEKLPSVYLDENLHEVPESEFSEALQQENTTKSVVQMAFCLSAPLDDRNRVLNRPEPTTTVQIQHVKDNSHHVPSMQRLAQVLGAALGSKSAGADRLPPLPQMGKLAFGMVAHEVGTMRMGKSGKQGVVDENLRMNGVKNLYVCDLSVFPVSPAANPTLTLVALAQRLSDHLLRVRGK